MFALTHLLYYSDLCIFKGTGSMWRLCAHNRKFSRLASWKKAEFLIDWARTINLLQMGRRSYPRSPAGNFTKVAGIIRKTRCPERKMKKVGHSSSRSDHCRWRSTRTWTGGVPPFTWNGMMELIGVPSPPTERPVFRRGNLLGWRPVCRADI